MTKVFKESEYYSNINYNHTTGDDIFNGINSDFGIAIDAIKEFPIRSALTAIGFMTVMYIGFKVAKKFGMIKARLRG